MGGGIRLARETSSRCLIRSTSEILVRTQRFYAVRSEAPDNFRGVAFGCSLFRGKNVRGREVANVLHKRDFQSVTATLSAVGSVSATRSVRLGRFYLSIYTAKIEGLLLLLCGYLSFIVGNLQVIIQLYRS